MEEIDNILKVWFYQMYFCILEFHVLISNASLWKRHINSLLLVCFPAEVRLHG